MAFDGIASCTRRDYVAEYLHSGSNKHVHESTHRHTSVALIVGCSQPSRTIVCSACHRSGILPKIGQQQVLPVTQWNFAEVWYRYTTPTLHCLAPSSLPFFSFSIIAHLAPPIMRLRRSSVFRPHVIGKGLGLLITVRIYVTSQISHALFPR